MSTSEKDIPLEALPTDLTEAGADLSSRDTEPEITLSEPQVPLTPVPGVPSYAGTRIEGRTTDEAKAYIQLLEQTVQEQKDRITTTERAPQAPVEPVEPEQNFFDNPTEVLRREVARAVAPINEQIAEFRAGIQSETVWSQAAKEIPDFGQYRHLVEQLVQGQGYSNADLSVGLLKNLYYTAVGWSNRHGEPSMNQPTKSAPQPTHIPQHRPSTAPLPTGGSNQPKQRELTENERRLAREWNMTPVEYLRLADENLELEGFSNDK